jgi:hypothetical protein
MKSRSSPPRRRRAGRAGCQFRAPPPGRSTAARSPMGWTRAPARGPAAAPPPSTESPCVLLSDSCSVKLFWWRSRGKGKERWLLAVVFGQGGAAHRRRQGAGRGQEGLPPPLFYWRCARRRKNLKASRVSRVAWVYIHHRFRRVRPRPSIWRSTAEMHRRQHGLESAQAGYDAGPLGRPSRWLLGPEPMRVK